MVTPGASWLICQSVDETRRVGECVGRCARAGDVIALDGPLGAGKTAFAQGIARGMGIEQQVTSPTYTILKEYVGSLLLAHFDFYRVSPQRPLDVEFADYIGGDAVCVIEWPYRAKYALPASYLHITLTSCAPDGVPAGEEGAPTVRYLHARAHGHEAAHLLTAFRAVGPGEVLK